MIAIHYMHIVWKVHFEAVSVRKEKKEGEMISRQMKAVNRAKRGLTNSDVLPTVVFQGCNLVEEFVFFKLTSNPSSWRASTKQDVT